MRRFPVVSILAALLTAVFLIFLAGCGGGTSTASPVVASITLAPTTISLNEGGVATLSAAAKNSAGSIIAADITFASSNPSIATISTGGLICGGVWDSSTINCNATSGQAGVGQVAITATSGNATATATVYVHLKVDRVVIVPPSGCVSTGLMVNATASAFSTSAPGCSQSSPCDITSTVGPIALASNDLFVVANSAGVEATYDSATTSPTYSSGGTITGSKGQTCNLSNFGVGGSSGIDPTFAPATNSPTYTSGGTINGSPGQTCNLSNFNGVTGATATVTLTATNTIASGAHLTVTAEGFGATTPPTSATLSNGTASCSGTATVVTALIGVGGGSGLSVVGAEATVALTGTNTIASGTQLTVTASGYGATSPPTTATLTSGTATCSGTANVITALNSAGVFTAESPGATSIFGSVSGVNSVSAPYLTCPVVEIKVHDAGSSNTSFTLSKTSTQPLTADVYDINGYIRPMLTWGSSSTASVTVAAGTVGNNPATITAVAPGTASITASCSYPNCNRGVAPQYSSNVVTATVTGTTSTAVFAASTNSTMLVPITTSTNAAGTAVTLPYLPNSMMTDPAGVNLYLGSSSGLMVVNIASPTVTTQPIPGTIMAISPDSNYMLISDTVNNVVYYYSLASAQNGYTFGGTTTSAAYTPDSSFDEFVSGNQLITGLPLSFSAAVALPYTAHALGVSAQGSLTYVTGSTPGGIDVRSTCNSAEVQTLSASSPTLIGSIPNGTGAVAADSPSVDVISSPGTLITPGCPVADTSTISSFDMGVGPFNARQLFFSPDSSRAWIMQRPAGVVVLGPAALYVLL